MGMLGLNRGLRLAARSTQWDAGTGLTHRVESQRGSIEEVVPAAAERVTQALRQLEEYSKVLSSEAAAAFKQLRYEAYDVLAKVELRLTRAVQSVALAHLYLLIDCSKPLEDFASYVGDLAEAGVDWFQLRDKTADGRQLLEYARAAQCVLAPSGSKLIINDRVDVAMACNAAGVHLGQEDMPLADARRLMGHSMLIGVSTHSVEQALTAEQAGADYIGCGPTFPSTTKQFSEFVGPELIRRVSLQVGLPVFAIGGIDLSNVELVVQAGCRRVAVSGAIHQGESPMQAAVELRKRLLS